MMDYRMPLMRRPFNPYSTQLVKHLMFRDTAAVMQHKHAL